MIRLSKLLLTLTVIVCSMTIVGCPSKDVIVIDDISQISVSQI